MSVRKAVVDVMEPLTHLFHRLEQPQLLQYSSSIWQDAYRCADLGVDLRMFFEHDVVDAGSVEAMCQREARNGASNNYHLEWRISHA